MSGIDSICYYHCLNFSRKKCVSRPVTSLPWCCTDSRAATRSSTDTASRCRSPSPPCLPCTARKAQSPSRPPWGPRSPGSSVSPPRHMSDCRSPSVTSPPSCRTWRLPDTFPPPGHSPHTGSRTESPLCRTRDSARYCRWARSYTLGSSRNIPAEKTQR